MLKIGHANNAIGQQRWDSFHLDYIVWTDHARVDWVSKREHLSINAIRIKTVLSLLSNDVVRMSNRKHLQSKICRH